MYAVFGASLLAVAVVLFQFAYVHHRRPVPSRWTRHELVSQLYCILIMLPLTFGIAYLANFLFSLDTEPFTLADAGLVLAVIAIAAIPVGALRRRWRRLQGEAASSAATVHELRPAGEGPDSGLPPQSGAGGRRRRAA